MFKTVWVTAAALVAAGGGVSSADAAVLAVQGRAQISYFAWSIYDADPNDGLAASMSFLDSTNAMRSLTSMYLYKTVDGEEIQYSSKSTYSPSTNLVPIDTRAQVVRSDGAGGSWVRPDSYMRAQGQVFDAGIGFNASAGFSTTATEGFSPTFYNLMLGPGTGVKLSAYGIAESWLAGGRGSYSGSYVQLFARFSAPAASGEYDPAHGITKSDRVSADLYADSPEVIANNGQLTLQMKQRNLNLTFENLTGQAMVGRIRALTDASGESLSVFAPVPELGSAALLLLGASGLVMLGRRQPVRRNRN